MYISCVRTFWRLCYTMWLPLPCCWCAIPSIWWRWAPSLCWSMTSATYRWRYDHKCTSQERMMMSSWLQCSNDDVIMCSWWCHHDCSALMMMSSCALDTHAWFAFTHTCAAQLAKLLHYARREKASQVSFAVFGVVFFITRLVIYPCWWGLEKWHSSVLKLVNYTLTIAVFGEAFASPPDLHVCLRIHHITSWRCWWRHGNEGFGQHYACCVWLWHFNNLVSNHIYPACYQEALRACLVIIHSSTHTRAHVHTHACTHTHSLLRSVVVDLPSHIGPFPALRLILALLFTLQVANLAMHD